MPEEDQPPPVLDFTNIAFPSDRLSLGSIRRLNPGLSQDDSQLSIQLEDVVGIFETEKLYAAKCFAAATGTTDPDPSIDLAGLADLLNDDYLRYGLSSGTQQTRLLLSEVERNVAAQVPGRTK